MSKRRRGVQRKTINRWIARFVSCQLAGVYEPFWRTEDLSSWGVKAKIPSFDDASRVVHLLSYNEYLMYLRLAFEKRFLEIYEQYPLLPISRAISVAEHLKIKYPIYQDTGTPRVMTTDFLCRKSDDSYVAFQVKAERALGDPRTEDKIDLERAILALDDIELFVVTDSQLRNQESYNLSILYPHRNLSDALKNIYSIWIPNFIAAISDYFYLPLSESINQSSAAVGVSYELSAKFMFYALWNEDMSFNLNVPLFAELEPSELEIIPNV